MNHGYLTLKEMIAGSGCTPRTVRYYEREGLLRAERSSGGHRLFERSQLERLDFIISLREAGWSLEEITAFLSIRENKVADEENAAQLTTLVGDQIRRLEHKLDVLGRLRKDLLATRELLPVCVTCTHATVTVSCGECLQIPAPSDQPRAFRLSWLAEPVEHSTFDDRLAHGGGSDDGDDSDDSDDTSHGSGSGGRR